MPKSGGRQSGQPTIGDKPVPKIKNVERQIWGIEGFAVRFLYRDGTDVRGDKTGLPGYPYERAASNDITVESWKQTRFRQVYPGYDVDVVNAYNSSIQGNTKLATVRDTYAE
jgi:hypothetical protein